MGLDASKFDSAQKKSVEHLRKFDEANQKSSKQAQMGAKAMNDGFLKLKETLIQVGVAVVGINGVKDFLGQMVGGNAALGRTSQLLGMNVKDLHAWGEVLKTVGGDAKDFQSSSLALQTGLANIRLGNAAAVRPLAMLGAENAVDIEKGTVNWVKFADAIVKSKDRIGVLNTASLAGQLGITPNMFQLLLQGPAAVAKLRDQYIKIDAATQANVDSAQALQKQWALLHQQSATTGQGIFSWIVSPLRAVLDVMSTLIATGNRDVAKNGFWATIFNWLTFGPSSSAEKSDFADPGSPMARTMLGPRGTRNNNPGNIKYGKFAIAHGAIGTDGTFAIFPTMKAGIDADTALLASQPGNGRDTISAIIRRLAPSSENNTEAYIADVSGRMKVDPNQPLTGGQYAELQKAMFIHEGNSRMVGAGASSGLSSAGGGTTVQTHINAINVHTQATDADGIARDMHQSLQNNALIGAGMMAGS